jgi:hypothetical protein
MQGIKNEGRLFRTGAKPICGKIDMFAFESDEQAAPDVGVAACCLSPLHYAADSEPVRWRTTQLRPVVEKIPGARSRIEKNIGAQSRCKISSLPI